MNALKEYFSIVGNLLLASAIIGAFFAVGGTAFWLIEWIEKSVHSFAALVATVVFVCLFLALICVVVLAGEDD